MSFRQDPFNRPLTRHIVRDVTRPITGVPVPADVIAPAIASATVAANGTAMTVKFNEALTIGAGGNGGLTVDGTVTGAGIAANYTSGDTTHTFIYTLASTMKTTDVITLDYVQPTNGLEDAAGNDLASVAAKRVTNNSTVAP